MRQLLGIIDVSAIGKGYVRLHKRSRYREELLNAGESLYERRMQEAGLEEIDADVVVKRRKDDEASPACLLGIIVTLGDSQNHVEGGPDVAGRLLTALQRSVPDQPLLLYVYYAPDPDQTLSTQEADALAQSLRE